ncbi:GNAT family N-acetyltransferase [Paraburkholderia jirisanensis]
MADSRILLRHASADDAATIARLHTSSWQIAYRDILPAQYLDAEVLQEHKSHWATYMAQPTESRSLVLIAEFTGKPVGFVSAEKMPDSPYGVLLDCLHVLKPFQGHGAGKLMIEAVRMWALDLGETHLHLYALEGNRRAIDFYERNGWQFAGVESSYIGKTPVVDRRYVIRA